MTGGHEHLCGHACGRACKAERPTYSRVPQGTYGGGMKRHRSTAAAFWLSLIGLSVGAAGLAPVRAADPLGLWYTEGKDSQVRIRNCGAALCGALVWLRQPNDPDTGRPKTDKNNADASKRNRPLLGAEIVLGMKPSGTPGRWDGAVYNAKDGKTYAGSFTLTGSNTAELKGCVLGGLL